MTHLACHMQGAGTPPCAACAEKDRLIAVLQAALVLADARINHGAQAPVDRRVKTEP